MAVIRLLSDDFRHTMGSTLAGAMVCFGWLVFLDAAIIGYSWSDYEDPPWYWWFPGPVSTLAFGLLNMVTLRDLSPYSLFVDPEVQMRMRLWLLCTMIFAMLPVAASAGIMVAMLATGHNQEWPAVAGFFQTLLIFLASLLFIWARMIGRKEAESYDSFN